jgi:hypothetical protein
VREHIEMAFAAEEVDATARAAAVGVIPEPARTTRSPARSMSHDKEPSLPAALFLNQELLLPAAFFLKQTRSNAEP